MPLTIGVLRWPGSPIEFVNDVAVLIPDQQMRIAPVVEADSGAIVYVALDDSIGRNGRILHVALVRVSVDHHGIFGVELP